MEAAEVFRLILTVIVLPPYIVIGRRLRPASGRVMLTVGVATIFLSYVFGLLDYGAPGGLFDTLQHLCYGVAGVSALVAAFEMFREASDAMGPA